MMLCASPSAHCALSLSPSPQAANDDLEIVLLDQSVVESFKVSSPSSTLVWISIESAQKKGKVVPYPHVRCRTSSDAVCVPCHGRHPEALPGLGPSQSDNQHHGGDQELTAPRGVHPADLRPAQDRGYPLCEYASLPPHHPVRKVTRCAPTLQRRRGCARLFYLLC